MTDELEEGVTLRYAGNSSKKKEAAAKKERVVQQVTSTPVVEKQSLGRKFARNFAGDSAQSVGQYVLFEVVLPSMKNLIFDMVSQGFQRLLYGTATRTRPGMTSSLVGSRSSSYSTMYRPSNTPSGPSPDASIRMSGNDEFSDLVSESRAELEMVLDAMQNLIDEYNNVSVADFKALVGINSEFTDQNRGWTNLSKAEVRHRREGYWLDLPPAKRID